MPSLPDRGRADGVAGRYVEMQDRGELSVLGEKTVPVAAWLSGVAQHVADCQIGAITMDRLKQAELARRSTGRASARRWYGGARASATATRTVSGSAGLSLTGR